MIQIFGCLIAVFITIIFGILSGSLISTSSSTSNNSLKHPTKMSIIVGSSESIASTKPKKYTYHKYNNTDRKYSERIEVLLKNDYRFIESNKMLVDWSDKNSKSRIKDYYPFPKVSFVDKKYLPHIFPDIIPNTYTAGNFNKFVKKCHSNVFFLKPADLYIGGSNGIKIDNDPYALYKQFISDKYVIQEEVPPMLIDGYKFDIRTYVLVAYNKQYMHIYYNYGIIRYCKEPYEPSSIDIDKQISIHGKFEYVIDNELLTPYLFKFKDIMYQTLLKLSIPDEIGYQYLGYDIIISNTGQLYLLEINIQPSLKRVNYDIDILNNFSELVVESVLTTNRGIKPFMSLYEDIILSDLNIGHLDDLYTITSDYSIMKYIGNLKVWSYDKTKRFIEYGNSDTYYYKAVLLNCKLVGIIGLHDNKLTIYLNILRKGIGSKALHLFLLTIDSTPIYADVLNTNEQSINFFKKLEYSYVVKGNIHRFTVQK